MFNGNGSFWGWFRGEASGEQWGAWRGTNSGFDQSANVNSDDDSPSPIVTSYNRTYVANDSNARIPAFGEFAFGQEIDAVFDVGGAVVGIGLIASQKLQRLRLVA